MRVLLDTTYARRAPHSGTGVYLECLKAALSELDGVEVIAVANPRRRPPGGGGLRSARNLLVDERWSELELPRRAREAGADLIHHPLPALAHASGAAQVVTVHDIAFEALPHAFDPAFRRVARFAHRAAARRAGAVICVSESTAVEVRARWGVPAERIVVAHHGPGQELPPTPAPAAPGGYFLYVGDDEPRKNLPGLLAAYRAYRETAPAAGPLDLVLAGSAHAGAEPGVRADADPGADRLAALYAGAAALVHASWHEGFGLTLLEAMNAGVPVLAAPSAAAREVCGDAARYADPDDARSFAAAMAELSAGAALRRELATRGRARASAFTWAESARRHLAAYCLALNMPADPNPPDHTTPDPPLRP